VEPAPAGSLSLDNGNGEAARGLAEWSWDAST
jgi:hypothetical protein